MAFGHQPLFQIDPATYLQRQVSILKRSTLLGGFPLHRRRQQPVEPLEVAQTAEDDQKYYPERQNRP